MRKHYFRFDRIQELRMMKKLQTNEKLYNISLPRHADGTCDYEDVSSVKTVSTPSTVGWCYGGYLK